MPNLRKTMSVNSPAETVASNTVNYITQRNVRKLAGPATVNTINGGNPGDLLTIWADGGIITLGDAADNISVGGADATIADAKFLSLIYNGTNWVGYASSEAVEAGEANNDAIHDNVASEISAVTAKGTPAAGDFFLIEDSAALNVKKSLTFTAAATVLAGAGLTNTAGVIAVDAGADSTALHSTVSGEIAGLTAKAAIVAADSFVIEDSADTNSKAVITLTELADKFAGANITNTAGVLSVSAGATAEGLAGAVQLSDGAGGFTDVATLTNTTTTLTAHNIKIAVNANDALIYNGVGTDDQLVLRGGTTFGDASLILHGQSDSAGQSVFELGGGTSSVDAAVASSFIAGTNAKAGATADGRDDGGDLYIYGGAPDGAGEEGNLLLAHDDTDARGFCGVGMDAPTHLFEVGGGETNLSTSPAADTDPSEVHIANYLDFVTKDIVLAVGGGAVGTVNLGWDLPLGAILIGAALNVQTAITGAGGGTAIGLGPAGTPAKYCETATLTLDSKSVQTARDLTTVALEDLVISATNGAGAQTGTIQNGSVRVRLTYIDMDDLPNA